jgi:two-component system, sensor histidine kinase and response regulator
MRQDQNGKIFFVAGAAFNNDAASLGDEYTDPGPALAANFAAAKSAFTEDDLYTDKWGTWQSGYAPIRKADGSIAGMLAVDYFAQVVQEKEAEILQSLWFLTLFCILLMGSAAYFILRSFFPAPEK